MKVTLNRGPVSTTVDVAPNETILDSLLRSGAEVSYCCRGGICGMCACTVVSGEVESVGPSVEFAATSQLKERQILICRSRPATDCVVQQAAAGWTEMAGASRSLVVSERVVLGGTVVRFRVSSAGEMQSLRFRAGQYVRLQLAHSPEALSDHLFIASRPGLPHLDFYMPLAAEDFMASRLQPGVEVLVGEPMGSASLREDETEPLVVVAEKAGLPSALGILEAWAAYQVSRPACLVMRGQPDEVLERLLMDLADRACLPFTLLAPSDERIGKAVEEAVLELESNSHVPIPRFRCYAKATRASIVSARAALHRCGMRPWNVHVDALD